MEILIIITVDRPELFKEKLRKGINLFTGAGFSVLPDQNGIKLPTGKELCKEISEKFPLMRLNRKKSVVKRL